MGNRARVGCAVVGLGVVGFGVWIVVTARHSINTLLEMDEAHNAWTHSCQYLKDCVSNQPRWPESETAFTEGLREYMESVYSAGDAVSIYAQYIRFNPDWIAGASVCSQDFPLQAVEKDLLPCEVREKYGGQKLADLWEQHSAYFAQPTHEPSRP